MPLGTPYNQSMLGNPFKNRRHAKIPTFEEFQEMGRRQSQYAPGIGVPTGGVFGTSPPPPRSVMNLPEAYSAAHTVYPATTGLVPVPKPEGPKFPAAIPEPPMGAPLPQYIASPFTDYLLSRQEKNIKLKREVRDDLNARNLHNLKGRIPHQSDPIPSAIPGAVIVPGISYPESPYGAMGGSAGHGTGLPAPQLPYQPKSVADIRDTNKSIMGRQRDETGATGDRVPYYSPVPIKTDLGTDMYESPVGGMIYEGAKQNLIDTVNRRRVEAGLDPLDRVEVQAMSRDELNAMNRSFFSQIRAKNRAALSERRRERYEENLEGARRAAELKAARGQRNYITNPTPHQMEIIRKALADAAGQQATKSEPTTFRKSHEIARRALEGHDEYGWARQALFGDGPMVARDKTLYGPQHMENLENTIDQLNDDEIKHIKQMLVSLAREPDTGPQFNVDLRQLGHEPGVGAYLAQWIAQNPQATPAEIRAEFAAMKQRRAQTELGDRISRQRNLQNLLQRIDVAH